MSVDPILVTGATGAQGGGAARRLLAAGRSVRFLTRDAKSPAAQALLSAGAEAVTGDLGDESSLAAAVRGVGGVFSVQVPGPDEVRHGFALIDAALKEGVSHFVHTSVTGTQDHKNFPGWGTGRWVEGYWTAKWSIEEKARGVGFKNWTVLRPAFMMENFIPPKVNFLFPHLAQREIVSAMRPDAVLQLISAEDIGAFAAAAFLDPATFNHQTIDLAGEAPTVAEIAAALSAGTGREIRAVQVTPTEAVARGLFEGWVRTHEWINEVGYRADIAALKRYSAPLTSFAQWIDRHRDEFQFA